MMHLAIQTLLLPGRDIDEKFDNAAHYGFDAVELVINPDFDLFKNFSIVQSAMSTSGLPISNLCTHAIHDPIHPDLIERRKRMLTLTDLMNCADDLGARGVICVPIRSPLTFPDLSPWKDSYQLTKALTIRTLGDWIEDLPIGQSALFLEPLNRYEASFLNRVEQALDICEAINHPRIQVLADFFHMNIEERNFFDPIINAGQRLGMVHIADNNRLQPGKGYLDFKPGFKALKEIDYQGFISIECWSPAGALIQGNPFEALPETMHYLHSEWKKTSSFSA